VPGPRILGLQKFPAVLNHHLAVILAQVTNVSVFQRNTNLVRKPTVGLLPGHASGLVELVEVVVGCTPERAELMVSKATHGNVRAGVYLHISVALWIPAADVEHRALAVLAVDAVRTPQHHRAAAVGTAHPLSFVFGNFMFTHIINSSKLKK